MVTAGYVLSVLASVFIFLDTLAAGVDAVLATALLVLWLMILTGAVTVIVWATGEPPRWRWGK
jgi:hypothetical protein